MSIHTFFVALLPKGKARDMLQRTTGIVPHILKYNDTSSIVEMYTELSGRASLLVTVPHSKKAVAKPVLFQSLALIEFEADYRPNTSLFRTKEAKPFSPFISIPYDPFRSAIALSLAELLYHAIHEEAENCPLFAYPQHSILWLGACKISFTNFHLVLLIRLFRFLRLYPNLGDYHAGDYFDMLNVNFISACPQFHSCYIQSDEAGRLPQLICMNYETTHPFGMNRTERARCLAIINEYYRLHLPDFPVLKSLDMLKELSD